MNGRVVCTRGGLPADVLTVIEEPEPAAPERGQVLIRTTAFPVHPGDLLAIEAGLPRDGCKAGSGRRGAHRLEQWVIDNVGPR
jgi:NADPH:quinone reductase-like Zn-dependent oxidoreductase